MSKHTKTPWTTTYAKHSASVRPIAPGGLIANFYLGDMPDNGVRDPDLPPTEGQLAEQTANAERVVDCVNACEGMDDPAKEIAQATEEMNRMAAKHEELCRLCSELVFEMKANLKNDEDVDNMLEVAIDEFETFGIEEMNFEPAHQVNDRGDIDKIITATAKGNKEHLDNIGLDWEKWTKTMMMTAVQNRDNELAREIDKLTERLENVEFHLNLEQPAPASLDDELKESPIEYGSGMSLKFKNVVDGKVVYAHDVLNSLADSFSVNGSIQDLGPAALATKIYTEVTEQMVLKCGQLREAQDGFGEAINIIVSNDGPDSRFIEIEDDKGNSISIGKRLIIHGTAMTKIRITVDDIKAVTHPEQPVEFEVGDKVKHGVSDAIGEVVNIHSPKGVLVQWPDSGGEYVKPFWYPPVVLKLIEKRAACGARGCLEPEGKCPVHGPLYS